MSLLSQEFSNSRKEEVPELLPSMHVLYQGHFKDKT